MFFGSAFVGVLTNKHALRLTSNLPFTSQKQNKKQLVITPNWRKRPLVPSSTCKPV